MKVYFKLSTITQLNLKIENLKNNIINVVPKFCLYIYIYMILVKALKINVTMKLMYVNR